jgi:NADPH:quinone reductase-like Zn-dependent oxidoreductase
MQDRARDGEPGFRATSAFGGRAFQRVSTPDLTHHVAFVRVRDSVSSGNDAVFDGIGANGFAGSWADVKRGGVLCAFGFSDSVRRGGSLLGLGATLLELRLWNTFGHARSRSYSITDMRKAHPAWFHEDLATLLGLLSRRVIAPRVAERIGLADVAAAHRGLETGHLDGKIVICP